MNHPLAILLLLVTAAGAALFRRYRGLRRRYDAMQKEKEIVFGFVHDIGEVFSDTDAVDMTPLLERVLFYALRICRAESGAVYMWEKGDRQLRARAFSPLFPPLYDGDGVELEGEGSLSERLKAILASHPVPRGEGLLGETADLGRPIRVADAERDSRLPPDIQRKMLIRTVMTVPMRFHNRVLGVLCVVNRVDGGVFEEGDLSLLQALADQASVSVHYAGLRETLEAKRRMDHDLSIARRIQKSLLPRDIPQFEGYDLGAFYVPAYEVGGDYYDFIRVDDDRVGLVVADVSGKGIAGAMIMSVCRSVLRASAPGNPSPADVLQTLNRVLNPDLDEDMFITAAYMILHTGTGELTYARAGHDRSLVFPPGGGEPRPLDAPGLAIGMADEDTFDSVLQDRRVTLSPGDLLVSYTDGVTEAQNAAGEEWGLDRLCAIARDRNGEAAESVLRNVREALARHIGDVAQYDDMTMLALRVRGGTGQPPPP